jgi:hypothetical protein
LEDPDVHERLLSHAAELSEEELQQLTVLNEPTHEGNNNAVVQTPQLTISVLKKGLKMVDDVVKHSFYVDHFKGRWLKFKHEICAVNAQYKEVCISTQLSK